MGVKARRWLAVIASVFTALALFVAPRTALAIENGDVYSDVEKGISIYVESNGAGWIPQALNIDVVVDGETVVTDHVVTEIPQSASTIHVIADEYQVSFDCGDDLDVYSRSANGQWGLTFGKPLSNTYDMTIYLTKAKTSADIAIFDDETNYGTFSWSKPTATNPDYKRNLIVKVNGDVKHIQEIETPEFLDNLNTNDEYWFTPNVGLYKAGDVEVSPDTLDKVSRQEVTVSLTTKCPCGSLLCQCPGGTECVEHGCKADEEDCELCAGNLSENSIVTQYGVIGYLPDDNGYKLTVEVYVNGSLESTTQMPSRILNSFDGNLAFTPSDGYYFANAENSYDLITNTFAPSWIQETGHLEFGGQLQEDKDYDNVLRIYLRTIENHINLNVDRSSKSGLNPQDIVTGYLISYDYVDPWTGEIKTTEYEATSFDAAQGQLIPTNTKVTLTAICKPGYEASVWTTDFGATSSLTGSEGAKADPSTDIALGSQAYLTVRDSMQTQIRVVIDGVRVAELDKDEAKAALGNAAVKVDCTNKHTDKTSALLDETFTIGESYNDSDGNPSMVDVTVDPDEYLSAYDTATGATHELVNPNQDKVIVFKHNGVEWQPAKGESPLVLEVKCEQPDEPETPDQPAYDDIKNLIDVKVTCSNQDRTHKKVNEVYDVMESSVTFDEVSGSAEDGFTCVVTIKSEGYAALFAKDSEVGVAHNCNETSNTVTLVYGEEGWTVADGSPHTVEFEVVCDTSDPDPEIPSIPGKLDVYGVTVGCVNDDFEHADVSYKLSYNSDSYSVGKVTSVDGVYTCDVTITNPEPFINKYSTEPKAGELEHVFVENGSRLKLTLQYNEEQDKWELQGDKAYIAVTCKPAQPDWDDLKDILNVKLSCVNEGNEHVKDSQTYKLFNNTFEVGDVTFDATSGAYICYVTITADDYIAKYVSEPNVAIEHWLAAGTPRTDVVSVKFENGAWTVKDGNPVKFDVTCAKPDAPGWDDINEISDVLSVACVNGDATSHYADNFKFYYGTWTAGEVTRTDEGWSCPITVTVDKYVNKYNEKYGDHELVDGQQETVTVTLVSTDGATWQLGEAATVKVTCAAPETPDAPEWDDLKLIKDVVNVACVNTDTSVNHWDKDYDFFDNGSYDVGEVQVDEADNITCVVTISNVDFYVDKYSSDFQNVKHSYVSEGSTTSVTLRYDADEAAWGLAENGKAQIKVTCATEPGTDPEPGDEVPDPEGSLDDLFKNVVKVVCNRTGSGHGERTYDLLEGGYELSWTEGSTTATVTLDTDAYVSQYESDMRGYDHTLVSTSGSTTVDLAYSNGAWDIDEGATLPVTITATCSGGSYPWHPGGGDDDDDKPGTDEPGTDEPGTDPDQPGTDDPGTDEPGTDEPGTGTDEPGTGTDQPGTDPDQPGTGTDQSGASPDADSDAPELPFAGDPTSIVAPALLGGSGVIAAGIGAFVKRRF